MKIRTLVISYVLAAYTLFVCCIMLSIPKHFSLRMFVLAVQWPLWIALIKKKSWAWAGLTIIYALLLLHGLWNAVISGLHVKPLGLLVMLLVVILPLWALLTDRPSSWQTVVSTGSSAGGGEE